MLAQKGFTGIKGFASVTQDKGRSKSWYVADLSLMKQTPLHRKYDTIPNWESLMPVTVIRLTAKAACNLIKSGNFLFAQICGYSPEQHGSSCENIRHCIVIMITLFWQHN